MMTTNNLLSASSLAEFFRILMELENNEKKIIQIPNLTRQTNMPPGVVFPEEDLLSIYPAATSLTDDACSPADLIKYIQEEELKEKCRECNAMIWADEDEVCFACYSKNRQECLEDPGDIPEKYRFDSV